MKDEVKWFVGSVLAGLYLIFSVDRSSTLIVIMAVHCSFRNAGELKPYLKGISRIRRLVIPVLRTRRLWHQ